MAGLDRRRLAQNTILIIIFNFMVRVDILRARQREGVSFRLRDVFKKMADENKDVIIRRNRPGTAAADMYNWPDQDYTEMDSTLDGKKHRG